MALNLSSGFTGVFSLGHIGFMALGAYVSAILTLPLREKGDYLPNLPGWLAGIHLDNQVGPIPVGFLVATLIAGVLVAAVAWLVGRVLMRLSGHFVAVATLGVPRHRPGRPVQRGLVHARLAHVLERHAHTRTVWWAGAWALVAVYVVWRLKRSPFGREMLAQREDRIAAQAVGIRVMEPRLLAFVVGAFFSAVAGALYAHFITSFSPTVFYFDLTFRVITMLVIGGMGSVSGSIVGAVAITVLAEGLRRIEDTTLLYGMSQIILAVIFIVIITFRRDGLLGGREVPLDRLFAPGWRERLPWARSGGPPVRSEPVDALGVPPEDHLRHLERRPFVDQPVGDVLVEDTAPSVRRPACAPSQ